MFEPKDNLTEQDTEQGLNNVIYDGVASQAMESLTVGPLLIAFALELGANNLHIGMIAALPFLSQIAQLPAVFLIEKIRKRKKVAIISMVVSRPMLLVMASAAFFAAHDFALYILLGAFFLRYLVGAFSGSAWNSWMRDFIPSAHIGRFFAQRLLWMTVASMILSVSAAKFVDVWARNWPDIAIYRYSVLLCVACICGLAGAFFLSRTPEPRMPPAALHKGFFGRLAAPFRDGNFRKLLVFMGTWNFAVNLAAPFFTVYMLKRLDYGLTTIIMLTVISQFANLFVIKSWGKIADHFSNKSVLRVAAPLFILCIFMWTFTTLPEAHAGTLPLLVVIHIFMGIATAGVTLASGNIGLKLAPSGEAAAYLSVNSLVNSMAAGIAPVIGGITADFFANRQLSLLLSWQSESQNMVIETMNLKHWDFFFLFATLIGLFAIYRLGKVKEQGEVQEKIVISELVADMQHTMRGMRNMSSITGLKNAASFPFERLMRKQKIKKDKPSQKPDPEKTGPTNT